MSERSRNWLYAGLIATLAITLTVLVANSPSEEDRAARIGASIMCPVCQGESIGDSIAPMARDMMDLVRERITQGATDRQIIDELLTAYGGSILLDPPVSGPTILLWAAPLVALLTGLGVIVWWRAHPGIAAATGPEPGRGWRATGALILICATAAVVVAVGFFLQDRDNLGGGLADVDVSSLDEVSNETMEAVIAANSDHPQIPGMRLALADRYLGEGDYRAAFPHYLAVAESNGASGAQKVAALAGLGWMTWDGNREAETALALFDQALNIDSTSVPVRYLKARVLRCIGSETEAGRILGDLLASDTLEDEWRTTVEAELTSLQQGEVCP